MLLLASDYPELTEDQFGFLLFTRDLSTKQLLSTYQSYCFLAEFHRVEDIWKRDRCRAECTDRGLALPELRERETLRFPQLLCESDAA